MGSNRSILSRVAKMRIRPDGSKVDDAVDTINDVNFKMSLNRDLLSLARFSR